MRRDGLGSAPRLRRAACVEESVLQRSYAAQLLATAGMDVVLACGTFQEFMRWLPQSEPASRPELLVVDLVRDVHSRRRFEAVAALRAAGIRVLALSPMRSRATARYLLDLQVEAIVSTSDSVEEFLAAVEAVRAGGTAIGPVASAAIHGLESAPRLSAQEERTLALYATGLTILQVAEQIGVRPDTARKYLKRVRAKYAAAGRPARTKLELAQIAWAEGYATLGRGAPAGREDASSAPADAASEA